MCLFCVLSLLFALSSGHTWQGSGGLLLALYSDVIPGGDHGALGIMPRLSFIKTAFLFVECSLILSVSLSISVPVSVSLSLTMHSSLALCFVL